MGETSSRIIFLGTGGDISVVSKQLRTSGGIVIRTEGNQFMIDPGPGALNNARKCGLNLRETICVLVSSNSLFLCNDINAVISAMTLEGLDRTGVLVGARSVIGDESRSILLPECREMLEKVLPLDSGAKIGINDVDIETVPTEGKDMTGLGFKFTCPKFTVGYTGCTSYNERLAESLKGSTVLIINCKNPKDIMEEGQMNADDAIVLAKEVKPKLVVLTFFGKRMLEVDPINVARDLQTETGIQAVAANDWMSIDPSHY